MALHNLGNLSFWLFLKFLYYPLYDRKIFIEKPTTNEDYACWNYNTKSWLNVNSMWNLVFRKQVCLKFMFYYLEK